MCCPGDDKDVGTRTPAIVVVPFRDIFAAYEGMHSMGIVTWSDAYDVSDVSNTVVGILRRARQRGEVRYEKLTKGMHISHNLLKCSLRTPLCRTYNCIRHGLWLLYVIL